MISSIEAIRTPYRKDGYFKKKLEQLFTYMDSQYESAANHYEFQCSGCEDNCCYTRFYHHTFVEFLYLLDGLDTLDPGKRLEIKDRADQVCKHLEAAEMEGAAPKALCPFNENALCIVYRYRPMICRLHGIPHELNTPGQGIRQNPGCDYFMKQHHRKDYLRFDRTSMYMKMANLEKEFRQKTGVTDKIKLTVAEMILAYPV